MKNLVIGIFHDEHLGRELGKKGTESDIAMFNRKTEEYIFTSFLQ
jgi:selenocysteine-specific translation elongation factor